MLEYEVVSAIASTVMSTVVAVVALVFSYRQNVGWRPVCLITDRQLSGTGGSLQFTLHLKVEFWNRRKYPVALRFTRADITGVQVLNSDPAGKDSRDSVRNNCAYKEKNQFVGPSASVETSLEVSFENQSLDSLQPLFNITIGYFDPHKNRDKTLKLKHRFFYPHLGWKKSVQERDNAVTAFNAVRAHK